MTSTPTADELLVEIQRLYRILQALPMATHPGLLAHRRVGTYSAGSEAYTALERQIRTHAASYWWMTEGYILPKLGRDRRSRNPL